MKREPTLSDVQRLTRARICAHCPSRTPGTGGRSGELARPCEARCDLFSHLPILYAAAARLDPMVGHRAQVMRRLIHRMTSCRHEPGTIHVGMPGYVHRTVDLFEELLG